MTKIKDFFADKKELIAVCFTLIFVIMIPFMHSEMLVGDDYEYHFTRIKSIQDSLEEKVFPVKIHLNMANGYGYGTGFFYPNFFLYLPAFLCMLGVEFLLSYKIFIVIMLALMFVVSYKSFKVVLEDRNTAILATIIYMLSNYIVIQLYKRAALGEFLGLIFVPAVIAGIYDYTHKDFKNPFLLGIGFWGVINSHLITTLICLIYAIVEFLFNIKSTIKNGKKFLKLLITAIIVALLTACFWGPMFEQMTLAKYKYNLPWATADGNDYGIYDLFSKNINGIGLFVTMSIPLIVIALFDKNISKKTKKYIIEFVIFVVIIGSQWFWEMTKPVTGMIQFKWRLLGVITVIAVIAIANILKEYCYKYEINFKIVTVVVSMIVIFFLFNQDVTMVYLDEKQVNDGLYSLWNSLGGGTEYLPLEMNVGNMCYPTCIVADDDSKIPYSRVYGRIEFEKNNSEQNIMNPPLIYYYGYVADIKDENGVVTPLELRKAETGLVEVVTGDKTGDIRIWYNGTRIQKISYLLSIAGYGLVVLILVIKMIKNRKK